MSLGTVAAVVGIAGTAYGAYNSNRAMRDQRNAQNAALANATTQLDPFQAMGLGGAIANRNAGSISLEGGILQPTSDALSRYAGAAVPTFSNQLPANVQQALFGFQQAQGLPTDLGLNGLDAILGGANSAFTQAQQGLSQAGAMANAQQGLQNLAFGNAQTQLGSLGQTYDQAYGNTLNTLREQARPEEERAMAGLTDNLFATGRLGSSGGALQTEAFARGLGQADLSRQLAATGQAQQAQQNSLGLATGQANLGMGVAQGMDSLLNNAFARFGNTSQLAADLNQARFARSMYGNELQYNRAQNMLGTQINLAGLPASLQAAQLGNVNSALSGQSGIQSQLLQLFGAGLSAEQAAANARIGAGSNMAQIVGNPNFGAAGQSNAAMWSQLGSALLNPNTQSTLSNLFGGGGYNIQSPDAWGALDAALASGQAGG